MVKGTAACLSLFTRPAWFLAGPFFSVSVFLPRRPFGTATSGKSSDRTERCRLAPGWRVLQASATRSQIPAGGTWKVTHV